MTEPSDRRDLDKHPLDEQSLHQGVDPDGDDLLDRDPGEALRLGDAGRPLSDTRDADEADEEEGRSGSW